MKMAVGLNQREWIWEFFLKNCKDPRMIQELMNALPFPEENAELKRMFLLRSLSVQVSEGTIDEVTLEMLQVLGEYGRVSAVTKERLATISSYQGDAERRRHCELELAVMRELAVRHLRGDSLDRKSFESALTKYWGDFSVDWEGWHGADVPGIAEMREQIKIELRMVQRNPELIDSVVQNYTKARVEDFRKTYLEQAWSATGPTFLERVSADVIMGKYKPVKGDGQRSRQAASPSVDGDGGQQSSGKVELPFIRASRGQYSKSREKLQKSYAMWDLDGGGEAGGAISNMPTDQRARVGEVQGGCSHTNRDLGDKDGVKLNKKILKGGEVRPSLPTEGGLEINALSLKFDPSVARVLDFEDLSGKESKDGQHQSREKENAARADGEVTEVEHLLDPTDDIRTGQGDDETVTGIAPMFCVSDVAEAQGGSDTIDHSEDRKNSSADGEKRNAKAAGDSNLIDLSKETGDGDKRMKEADSPKGTESREESGSPHKEVNKENIVPQLSSKPVDSNPTVCFSLPRWEGSPGVPPEAIARRKRRHGLLIEETDVTSPKGDCSSDDGAAPTTCKSPSPDTVSVQRNLRRKQQVLDAVVQDPLPKILTSSRHKGSLLERNATARTEEWEDDDDIEDSPSRSPSASRHVRLPRPTESKISPLHGSKTGGNINAKHGRRKPRRWSEKEVECLKNEVAKYGKGRWKFIQERNLSIFQGRTEVDLKDKWRNLEKFEGIRH